MAIAAELKVGVSFDTSKFEKSVDTIKETLDKLKDQWIADNKTYEEVYRDYHAAKEKLDNKSFKSFEENEEAKTTVEAAENDSRLKSYTAYKDAEEAKNKQVLENTKKLAKTLTLSLTTPLVGLAGFGLKAASKIEDYTASFKTLLGTEPAAKKMIKTINEMAAATPFDPDPLIQSTEKLLAFGIEAENVNDVLNMLGDSSKGSAEALQTLSTAYGKVAAKGKASMEELNMMIDRGVPILGELANVMGVTENEVIKLTSEGKVGFNEVNKAFQNMTSEGGVFYKGMETASQTLSGKLSTLKGNISMLGASIMEEVLPTVKKMVDFANEAVKAWTNMGDGMKTVILAAGTAAASFGPLIGTFAKLSQNIDLAKKGMLAFNAAAKANPYILLAAGIAAATVALAGFIAKQNEAWKSNPESFKAVLPPIESATLNIRKMGESADRVTAAIKELNEATSKAAKSKATVELTSAWEELATTNASAVREINDYYDALEKGIDLTNDITSNNLISLQNLVAEMIKSNTAPKYIDEQLQKMGLQVRAIAEIKKEAQQIVDKNKPKQEIDNRTEYEKDLEAHNEYVKIKEQRDYKASLIAQGLIKGNTDVLDKELKKREARENKYQSVIAARKENAAKEEAAIREKSEENLKSYLQMQGELISGQYKGYEEYYQKDAAAQRLFNDNKLQDYIDYLQDRKKHGKELTAEEESLLFRWVQVNNSGIEQVKKKIGNASNDISKTISTISSAVGNVSSYINSSFEALSYTTSKLQPLINNAFGASTKSLMSNFATAASQISSIMNSDMPEGMKETQSALAGVGAGLQAVGDISNAVFGAILDSIQADMDAINDELSKSIEKIRAEQEATISEIDKNLKSKLGTEYQMGSIEKEKKAKLDALKEEFAERGVILETGYETELEKAQEAYQKSIDAYKEALDEYTELGNENEAYRNEQLELYKQALEGKTDKELEEALKNKEMELEKSAMLKNEERKRTAEEKLQEATRNKNLAEAETQKQKILQDAENAETKAKIEAENARMKAGYESEKQEIEAKNAANKALDESKTQAFYADMASQIANVWINAAAGTVAAWASCMPLGPIAGPIAAGVLTGAMMTVAGVQTGLIASQSPPQPTPAIALPSQPSYIPVPQFAEGVTAFRGGMALVGEEGPELVTLPQGSNVITNENTNDILQTLEDVLSGAGGDITVNVTCVIDGMEIPIKEQLIEIQRDEMYRSRR